MARRRVATGLLWWRSVAWGCALWFAMTASFAAAETSASKSGRVADNDEHTIRWATCVLVPSFSPYVRMSMTWSRQAQWIFSSVRADWPPPMGQVDASSLLDDAKHVAWHAAMIEALQAGEPIACTEEAPPLARGEGWIFVQWGESDTPTCVMLHEDLDTTRWSSSVDSLASFVPALSSWTRWTHPFWLRNKSGVLRLELKGTAMLHIDDAPVGKVNGVVILRLPAGTRHLQLAVDGDETPRELTVHLRADQTTILRVSVQEDAPLAAPTWYDDP